MFSPNPPFLLKYKNMPGSPHIAYASSHMSGHHLWRLCGPGGLGASVAQDLRALRLWQSSRQWRAVPRSCMDAALGCRLQRRSRPSTYHVLTAWPGRVAQAPRAGRASARSLVYPWSCSPYIIGARLENRTVGGSTLRLSHTTACRLACFVFIWLK